MPPPTISSSLGFKPQTTFIATLSLRNLPDAPSTNRASHIPRDVCRIPLTPASRVRTCQKTCKPIQKHPRRLSEDAPQRVTPRPCPRANPDASLCTGAELRGPWNVWRIFSGRTVTRKRGSSPRRQSASRPRTRSDGGSLHGGYANSSLDGFLARAEVNLRAKTKTPPGPVDHVCPQHPLLLQHIDPPRVPHWLTSVGSPKVRPSIHIHFLPRTRHHPPPCRRCAVRPHRMGALSATNPHVAKYATVFPLSAQKRLRQVSGHMPKFQLPAVTSVTWPLPRTWRSFPRHQCAARLRTAYPRSLSSHPSRRRGLSLWPRLFSEQARAMRTQAAQYRGPLVVNRLVLCSRKTSSLCLIRITSPHGLRFAAHLVFRPARRSTSNVPSSHPAL